MRPGPSVAPEKGVIAMGRIRGGRVFAKVSVSGVVQVQCGVRAREEVQSSSNPEVKNRKSVLESQHFYFGFWV
jgi:hypothetical protein